VNSGNPQLVKIDSSFVKLLTLAIAMSDESAARQSTRLQLFLSHYWIS